MLDLPCRVHPVGLRRLVDEVVWVKMTVNRRLAKSHGYYLQHAKEVRRGVEACGVGLAAGMGQGAGADHGVLAWWGSGCKDLPTMY